jgi:hypothetical protein
MKIFVSTSLVLMLMLFVAGCSIKSHGYLDKTVSPDTVVALQRDGVHNGTWQTFDLVIDYQYEYDEGLLYVTGQIELGQHYQIVYDRVRSLWVYLFLTDADNVIIESISLPANMTGTEDRSRFSRYVKVTDDVRGLSFGYDGRVYEFDGHDHFYYP